MSRKTRNNTPATKWNIILALVVCGTLLLGTGAAKRPVERPMKCHGIGTVVVDLAAVDFDPDYGPFLTWTVTGRSEMTHAGRCTEAGSGRYYILAGFEIGSGSSMAANGDELHWDAFEIPGDLQTTLTWTGGTGRFENATGGLTFAYTITKEEQVGTLLVRTFEYRDTGTGTITY